jgi:ORF6N domain
VAKKLAIPQAVEYSNQRILSTKQIAELFSTDTQIVTNNFNRNKSHYTAGKHYYALEGTEKSNFLNQHQIDLGSRNAKTLYLWTEKGALLHAKSLGTDEAWEMYEKLVDEYYRLREEISEPQDEVTKFLNELWIKRSRLFGKYTKIPYDKWCVYLEINTPFHHAEMRGYKLPEDRVPDISVGSHWCRYAQNVLQLDMQQVEKYPHHYPDDRGIQPANIYPIEWIGPFRKWFWNIYLPKHLPEYLRYIKASSDEIEQAMIGFGIKPAQRNISGQRQRRIR